MTADDIAGHWRCCDSTTRRRDLVWHASSRGGNGCGDEHHGRRAVDHRFPRREARQRHRRTGDEQHQLHIPGAIVANAVTTELPTSGPGAGAVQLWFHGTNPTATTHVLVDIVGYYQPAGTSITPIPGPTGQPGAAGPAGAPGPQGSGGCDRRAVPGSGGHRTPHRCSSTSIRRRNDRCERPSADPVQRPPDQCVDRAGMRRRGLCGTADGQRRGGQRRSTCQGVDCDRCRRQSGDLVSRRGESAASSGSVQYTHLRRHGHVYAHRFRQHNWSGVIDCDWHQRLSGRRLPPFRRQQFVLAAGRVPSGHVRRIAHGCSARHRGWLVGKHGQRHWHRMVSVCGDRGDGLTARQLHRRQLPVCGQARGVRIGSVRDIEPGDDRCGLGFDGRERHRARPERKSDHRLLERTNHRRDLQRHVPAPGRPRRSTPISDSVRPSLLVPPVACWWSADRHTPRQQWLLAASASCSTRRQFEVAAGLYAPAINVSNTAIVMRARWPPAHRSREPREYVRR